MAVLLPLRGDEVQGEVVSITAEEVGQLLKEAKEVVIVPGYGMAVAQAQHTIYDITKKLRDRGIQVRFAIHPVAWSYAWTYECVAGRGQGSL